MTGKTLAAFGLVLALYEPLAGLFHWPLVSRWTGKPRLVRDAWLAGMAIHFYLERKK